MRSFLRRLGAAALHIDDLVHDVFVIAYQRFGDYDRSRPARPWLFAIALRRFWTFSQRAAVRREVREEVSRIEDEGPQPDESLADREKQVLLARGLEALHVHRRAVFVMHDIEGCSAPEIAEALDVPLNTVYSRLRRARAELEQTIRDLCGGSDAP